MLTLGQIKGGDWGESLSLNNDWVISYSHNAFFTKQGGEIARACSIWFRTEILICENYVPTFDQWQIFGIWWIRIHRSMNFVLVIKIATYIMYNSSQCMTWYSQCLWYTDWVSSFFRKFTSKNDGCIDVSVLKSWKNFVSFRSHS